MLKAGRVFSTSTIQVETKDERSIERAFLDGILFVLLVLAWVAISTWSNAMANVLFGILVTSAGVFTLLVGSSSRRRCPVSDVTRVGRISPRFVAVPRSETDVTAAVLRSLVRYGHPYLRRAPGRNAARGCLPPVARRYPRKRWRRFIPSVHGS